MEAPGRVPLACAVSDCAKMWFEETLKEAKSGDSSMQALVGQMYSSGYGVARDEQKGHAWTSRASSSGASVTDKSCKQQGEIKEISMRILAKFKRCLNISSL
ncbi:hypothetical protein ACFE04_018379 [Oxalis oulophora]